MTRTSTASAMPLFDLESEIGGWATALRLISLAIVTGYLTGLLDVPRMDAWVNFALLLATLAAATVLFSKRLWLGDDPLVRQMRRRLVKVLVAVVALFAIEGSVVDSFNRDLAHVEPTLGELPQGVPALACVGLLLLLAIRLSHRCAVDESAVAHTNPAAGFQLAAVPAPEGGWCGRADARPGARRRRRGHDGRRGQPGPRPRRRRPTEPKGQGALLVTCLR